MSFKGICYKVRAGTTLRLHAPPFPILRTTHTWDPLFWQEHLYTLQACEDGGRI